MLSEESKGTLQDPVRRLAEELYLATKGPESLPTSRCLWETPRYFQAAFEQVAKHVLDNFERRSA